MHLKKYKNDFKFIKTYILTINSRSNFFVFFFE